MREACDAYYGSPSPLAVEFVRAKKPVMIAYYRVYKDDNEMWYVIQTRTGFEKELTEQLEGYCSGFSRENCLIPMYEDVRRSEGQSLASE